MKNIFTICFFENNLLNNQWFKIAIALTLVALAAIALLASKKSNNTSASTRSLVYGAVCISIASVLNLFKFKTGALMGGISGSVTMLRMFPLILYACVFGVTKGVLACVAYGFVDMLFGMDASGGVLQVLLDYPIAFGLVGLAGLARNSKSPYLLGTAIATLGRFCASFLSGAVFFYMYAPEGWNVWVYSLVYQCVTVVPDMLLVFIAFALVQHTKNFTMLKNTMLGQEEMENQ